MNIFLLDGLYVYAKAPWLSWNELFYGLEHGYVDEKGVSDFACKTLTSSSAEEIFTLASLSSLDNRLIFETLLAIAMNEKAGEESLVKPWIFLVLSFLFENKKSYKDPLNMVERLYVEFQYPEEIAPIVRYTPLEEGKIGSEKHLFENWENIISDYNFEFEVRNKK